MTEVAQLSTTTHDEASELPRRPEADEWWQDSAFISWYDPAQAVGGMIRLGHEPNHAGGRAALWFGLTTPEGVRFQRNTATPLGPDDRLEDGFGAHGGRYGLTYDGAVRLTVHDEDVDVELTVEDFYPRTDFFAAESGSLSEEFASNHFETSGRVTGSARVGGRSYEIDGFCHRDRSWGTRRWDTLLNHRWVPGTFGPHLSFGSLVWHSVDGDIVSHGYVVRDGEVIRADGVDVAVLMEPDGITFRGGTAALELPDGERFALDVAIGDAFLSQHHGVACVDSVSRVEHDGMVGFCAFEVTANPRAGTGPVTAVLRANHADGLTESR